MFRTGLTVTSTDLTECQPSPKIVLEVRDSQGLPTVPARNLQPRCESKDEQLKLDEQYDLSKSDDHDAHQECEGARASSDDEYESEYCPPPTPWPPPVISPKVKTRNTPPLNPTKQRTPSPRTALPAFQPATQTTQKTRSFGRVRTVAGCTQERDYIISESAMINGTPCTRSRIGLEVVGIDSEKLRARFAESVGEYRAECEVRVMEYCLGGFKAGIKGSERSRVQGRMSGEDKRPVGEGVRGFDEGFKRRLRKGFWASF